MGADPTDPLPAGRRVAAFDFDGTLSRRDTLLPFLALAHGRRRTAQVLAEEACRHLAGRGRAGRDHLKARVLGRLFAGDDPARVAAVGRRYAATLPGRLRPQMLEQIAWHRRRDHEVVIVSASLLAYLEPLGAELGVHHVIGVGLAIGDDGRLSGEITGLNVRGPEKAARLRAWFAGQDATELWAYGDSSGDQDLLAMATTAVWMDGRPRRKII
ncbi:HAD family hydrolase [soil metagenome]